MYIFYITMKDEPNILINDIAVEYSILIIH